MDVTLIALGVLLVVATLLDAFLAVLNYDEPGPIINRIVRAAWRIMRAITRRTNRRWRPLVLRQATGMVLLISIGWWIAGAWLGFTLIYLAVADGASNGPADTASPFPVVATTVSLVLLSFIITFLSNVYRVIRSLRRLSANFFQIGEGIGDPIDTLAPYFPDGHSRELAAMVRSILDSLNDYAHGLAQNRIAYYFQSGRDQFSLPFSVHMTAGVIAALRWGLPAGSDPTKEPDLIKLTAAFEEFRIRLLNTLRWSTGPLPSAVSADEFAQAVATFSDPGSARRLDPWVLRFLAVEHQMRQLTQSRAPYDRQEAYQRYLRWLPFEIQAQQFLAAISRDLDYQPIYRGVATTPDERAMQPQRAEATQPAATVDPETGIGHRRPQRWRGLRYLGWWIRRRHLFLDPGYTRLTTATRSLVAVVVSIGAVFALSAVLGTEATTGAVLAALVALFASSATRSAGRGIARFTGLLAVAPTAIGVVLGGLLPDTPMTVIVSIALVAAAAAWSGRFGAQVWGLGQLLFVTFYFTLLLSVDQRQLGGALLAAGVGLLMSWASQLVPGPGVTRRITDGVGALLERTGVYLEAVLDVVSTGRRDRRLVRIIRGEQAALRNTASFIIRQLDDSKQLPPAAAAQDLRVKVLDVQLAAEHLITVLPEVSNYAIRVDQRARLAAELVAVQRAITQLSHPGSEVAEPQLAAEPPAEWPGAARRLHLAIYQLRVAVAQLHQAGQRDLAGSLESDPETDNLPAVPQPVEEVAAGRERLRSLTRRQAVQAGLATALALWLGSFVSASHQLWAAMPAFQVLAGSDGETRVKAIQRFLVTLLGATLAFGFAILTGHDTVLAFMILGTSVFLLSFFRAVSSPWTALALTILLATMYDVLGTLDVETTEIRVAETAIGAVVAILVAAVVLPTRSRARVTSGMGKVVQTASEFANTILQPLGTGAPAASHHEIVRLVDELNREMNLVQAAARPLRHRPGTLAATSIDAQLASLWAVIYYERHAAADAAKIADNPVAPHEWQRLRAATEQNFAAAQSVLADQVPARLHEVGEFIFYPGATTPREVRDLLIRIERVNQATLQFVEAVKPGTVTRDP